MNEQELKALWTYLKQIEKNTSANTVERQKHFEEDLEKYTELMVAVGTLNQNVLSFIREVKFLTDEVKNQTKEAKKDGEETVKSVEDATSELKEHIEGNVKVIVKEVDKKNKSWFQFWRKDHSMNGKKNNVVQSA